MHTLTRFRFPVLGSLLALAAALLLAACGGDDSGDDTGADPASVTPPDTPLYLEAVVRPEGEQKDDLLAAIGTLTQSDDPGAMISEAVESEIEAEGISYSEDIEPWLGPRAGLFLTDFTAGEENGAALLAVTDEGAANDFIDKAAAADDLEEEEATYEGVTYQVDSEGTAAGLVGDFVVAGTEDAVKAAIDASNGDSLADDSAATDALDSSVENSIFRAYVDGGRILDAAVEAGAISRRDLDAAGGEQLDALRDGPIVISGGASSDSMTIEASAPASAEGEGTEIVSTLPSQAWLAIGVPMVGESIATGYQQLLQSLQSGLGDIPGAQLPDGEIPDVNAELEQALGLDLTKDLAWAGDLGAFVQGSTLFDVGGGIVIETDDEDAASDALGKLRRALSNQPDLEISNTPDGFQVLAGPAGAEAAVRDGKVVIAIAGTTVDEVLSPSETLADDSAFESASSALGDGLTPALYVAFSPIVSLVDAAGQADPSFEQARPVLESLNYLVAGSGTSDDRSIGRLVLGLQEGGSSEGAAATLGP